MKSGCSNSVGGAEKPINTGKRNGRHEETRTPDLYRVKSRTCPIPCDTEEARVASENSAHAGPTHLCCSWRVTRRRHAIAPDMSRDGRVTTQVTTQNFRALPRFGPSPFQGNPYSREPISRKPSPPSRNSRARGGRERLGAHECVQDPKVVRCATTADGTALLLS
jgi:hypothetical protein